MPLFSLDELPNKTPAFLPYYSIGEEVSSSVPLAIAWSSSGLGKHGRCALATLTANLVLSIWSANGTPQEEVNWSRTHIVNDSLEKYFSQSFEDEPSHITLDSSYQLRLRTRIRAFTWAPTLPDPDAVAVIGTRLRYGPYLMAVTNDDNQVIIVKIQSPTSTFGTQKKWTSNVLTHFSVLPDADCVFSEPVFFEDMMKQQKHISHIAWSPWIVQENVVQCVVVYSTNSDVRARTIIYSRDEITLGDEIIYLNVEMGLSGMMKWSPRVDDDDNLTLALFTPSGLVYLSISAKDASILKQTVHDLDARWDPISGVAWDSAVPSTPRLHFCSLLSTLQSSTATLEASYEGLKSLQTPNWSDQIDNNLVLFSVKNDLKGNCKAKVWGLATSPSEDFIAACSSVHPSDMIEYGPPADRRSSVAISTLRQHSAIRKGFPAKDVSAEGVLFTVKRLLENSVEDEDQISAFADEIHEELLRSYAPITSVLPNEHLLGACPESDTLCSLIEQFKKSAVLNSESLKDRYTILVSHACKTTASNDLCKILIAYRLALAVQTLPKSLSQTVFSAEILTHHQQLISLIKTLLEDDTPGTTQPEDQDASTATREIDVHDKDTINQFTATNTQRQANWVDNCDFCSAPIPFTDLSSAACTNGHQFPRCGLSFLAIQAPGITKYCNLCRTPFFSEEFIAIQEAKPVRCSSSGAIGGNNSDTANLAGQGQNDSNGVPRMELEAGVTTGDGEGNEVHLETNDASARIDGDTVDLPITLARVLFLACDVCVYCGGKFVG